jgi:hypothetical protein
MRSRSHERLLQREWMSFLTTRDDFFDHTAARFLGSFHTLLILLWSEPLWWRQSAFRYVHLAMGFTPIDLLVFVRQFTVPELAYKQFNITMQFQRRTKM